MYVAEFNSRDDTLKQSSKRTEELTSMKTLLTHALNCFLDVCEFEIQVMYKQYWQITLCYSMFLTKLIPG